MLGCFNLSCKTNQLQAVSRILEVGNYIYPVVLLVTKSSAPGEMPNPDMVDGPPKYG